MGEVPVELDSGVGHAVGALDFEGQKRMARAGGRPGIFIDAQEPDGVCGEAGGLGWAGDQNRRVARFGRVEGLVEGAGEGGDPVTPTAAAAIEAERTGGVNGLLEAAMSLKLRAGERVCAGPCELFEEAGNEVSPCERALRLAASLVESGLGMVDALEPGCGKRFRVRCGGVKEGTEGPLGPLEAAAAEGAHVSLKGSGFLVVGAEVA